MCLYLVEVDCLPNESQNHPCSRIVRISWRPPTLSYSCITRSLPVSAGNRKSIEAQRHASARAAICLPPQLSVFWPAQELQETFPKRQTTYPLSPPLMSTFVCLNCSHQDPCGVALIHSRGTFHWHFCRQISSKTTEASLTSLFGNMSALLSRRGS